MCKTQMDLKLVFISSKDTGEGRNMYVKNENIIVILVSNISYLSYILSYNIISYNIISYDIISYIITPKWLKSKKATDNPKT